MFIWVQPYCWNNVLLAGHAESGSKGKALISVSDKTDLAMLAKVSSCVMLPSSVNIQDIISGCIDR